MPLALSGRAQVGILAAERPQKHRGYVPIPAVFGAKAPRFRAKASRFSAAPAFLLNAVHSFHHGCGGKIDHQLAFHEIHVGRHMLEVAFPAGAEIRMAGMAGSVGDEARSRTVAVARQSAIRTFCTAE